MHQVGLYCWAWKAGRNRSERKGRTEQNDLRKFEHCHVSLTSACLVPSTHPAPLLGPWCSAGVGDLWGRAHVAVTSSQALQNDSRCHLVPVVALVPHTTSPLQRTWWGFQVLKLSQLHFPCLQIVDDCCQPCLTSQEGGEAGGQCC